MVTVLVIDDSPSEMAKFRDILTKNNFAMLEASNGELGIKLAMEHLPDLILMDVVMPEMNGFQATRKIARNQSTAHIPIIIVSTKNQKTDKVWGQRQGASDYVTKPFSEQELLTVIKKVYNSDDDTPPHDQKKNNVTSVDTSIGSRSVPETKSSFQSSAKSRSSILDRIKANFQL